MGAVFSAMKAEYVVVAEQAHPFFVFSAACIRFENSIFSKNASCHLSCYSLLTHSFSMAGELAS